jgi:hypothetical protein
MALVAVGVTLAVALVIDITLGEPAAVILAVATALWFGWFWFVVPLWRRSAFEEG